MTLKQIISDLINKKCNMYLCNTTFHSFLVCFIQLYFAKKNIYIICSSQT
jgi:hypothetical protein